MITDDEFTVLMIAERGETMIPIGRWEQPVKDLAARGLLRMLNDVNYVITDSGRKAVAERDRQDDQVFARMLQTGSAISVAANQLKGQAERMAQTLAEMARVSAQVTGESNLYALGRWIAIVQRRAQELL